MPESINEFLTDDHRRQDEILEQFQECKASDPVRARGLLAQFAAGLYRHLQWEETLLFPVFEQKTGQTGLPNTLRGEHQEIREHLEVLIGETGVDESERAYEEKMLVEELGGHNAREEYAFYPEFDKLLNNEDRARLLEAMMASP